ncbi:MAG: DNA double-strand break repair nuclease NurA, partial [Anaerolineales bacterium]
LQQSHLFFGEELDNFSDTFLALQRDLLERKMILDLGKLTPPLRVALVDGPLEIWLGNKIEMEDLEQYRTKLKDYFDILGELFQEKVIFAGYIDRPESNYLVRMLELVLASQSGVEDIRKFHPFQGITDVDILKDTLMPTQRSAIFELQSSMNLKYPDHSRIYFFYVNVGSQNQPWLGRIEIPAWVSQDIQLINLIHETVVKQCQIMGNAAYPYVLHRAHELAVVTQEEKEEITRWIMVEMQRGGLPAGAYSHKQALKNLSPRQLQRIKHGGKL